jgi:hypothetical protein
MKAFGPIPALGLFLSWCAWSLMLGIGVLHSADLCSTTIGYDTAMGIVLCFVPPVLFLVGSVARILSSSKSDD